MQRDSEVVKHVDAPQVTHEISEVFHSIQGEGVLTGTPSTFIRYAKCNLACAWCDAAYTWKGNVVSVPMDTAELAAACEGTRHVVITGGEPTIAPGFPDLVKALRYAGHHITVETNGTQHPDTVDPDWRVKLWSVSPKLGSSGQRDKLDRNAVAGYALGRSTKVPHVQLKFVIDSESDLDEAIELLDSIHQPRYLRGTGIPIIFQPNGLMHSAQVMIDGHRELTDQGVRKAGKVVATAGGIVDVELQTPYMDRVRELYDMVLSRDDLDGYDVRVMTQAHKWAWGVLRGH